MPANILFIDDDAYVLRAYQRGVRCSGEDWQCTFTQSPLDAWEQLQSQPFDTVVSDVRMPGLNGLELLERIQACERTRIVPVIIVTGEADRSMKRAALELGAADLLNKPVDRDDLTARINSSLRSKSYADLLRQSNEELEEKVRQRTRALDASRLDIIWRLGNAAEFRDAETGNHVVRVGWYSRIVAESLGMDRAFTDTLFLAGPLHDIGKIGIPDSTLLKPSGLNADEWKIMQRHCEIGVSILSDNARIFSRLRDEQQAALPPAPGCDHNPVIEMAACIAGSHHEKWDGTGYPHGLRGEEIPLEGRIVAIADVFDALQSKRPYKEALSVNEALDTMEKGRGSHFDPAVYDAFIRALDRILEVRSRFSDEAPCQPAHLAEAALELLEI